jgi:uncharacterized protein YyaL (SSP411 family)
MGSPHACVGPHAPLPRELVSSDRPINRLAAQSSPYLLQHQHNPVDWFAWGEEAFVKARSEDKPIFLSVGYSTCHWCHVMERESFEDDAIARRLAEGFIAVKVDREELPDVDSIYMQALQLLTGRGGWPMNLFLTPQLAPFFGGTYFPPRARAGLPGFAEVLAAVRSAWVERREHVELQARALLDRMRGGAAAVPRAGDLGAHPAAMAQIAARFDPVHGGFGNAPKFPHAPLLQYLLAVATNGDATACAMLETTLLSMASGGIYDHVGGGFARYATDARWHVPHFEKMLSDNAQLVRIYAGMYRLTGHPRLRFVAEDTLAYLMREMHPAAAPTAYSCAQDADAEGVEGRFHVWTAQQFREVLGTDASAAARLYGVTEAGNWEAGMNVLERRNATGVCDELGLSAQRFAAWEQSVRERLYAARAARVWPACDDKVLADWNGMTLRALAEAGRLLQRPDLIDAARALARFLLTTLVRDGRVHHAWRDGTLRSEGYLADCAQVGLGWVELHAACGEPQWLFAAGQLCTAMVERFYVNGQGLFDADASELPSRPRDPHDGATPSATAAACELLLRLSAVFDRPHWRDIALDALERHANLRADAPLAVPALLHIELLAQHGCDLVVPAGPGGDELWAATRGRHVPLATLVHAAPGALPILEGRSPGQAYRCRFGSCGLPASSVSEWTTQLEEGVTD